jgi:polyene macrolide polyketide synthase
MVGEDRTAPAVTQDSGPAPAVAQDPGPAPAASPAGDASPDLVGDLFRRAFTAGNYERGMELLLTVARLRPAFTDPAEAGRAPRPVRLAGEHDDPTRIVFCNPTVPLTGAHVLSALVPPLSAGFGVSALSSPGFVADEKLPADLAAWAGWMADTVTGHVGDRPFVLAGWSSGGLAAYEAAHRLVELGRPPAAVVLLDTYAGIDIPREMVREILSRIFEEAQGVVPVDGARLSAWAWVWELLRDWKPRPLPVPTLLVRATEPIAAAPAGDGWQTTMPGCSTVLDVPGDHYSLMEKHAAGTAQVVREWLRATGL